ncbi:hypothetical protein O3P69_013355 [Scylla paramamosain]|uniref:Uncharacterized protein n=1 Tax=Scylla paramamosain TaxID=85552 RepID=A0AAW0U1G2_SCYPA
MRSGTFGKPGPPRRPGRAAGQDRPVPQLAIKLITLASRLEERALQEGREMSHSSPHPHPPLAAFEPAACYAVVYMKRCRLCLEVIRRGRDGREGGAGRAGKEVGGVGAPAVSRYLAGDTESHAAHCMSGVGRASAGSAGSRQQRQSCWWSGAGWHSCSVPLVRQRGAISGSGCHDYGMVGRQATLDSRPGRSRGMTSGIKSQCWSSLTSANTGRRAVLRQGSQRDGQCPRVYLVTRLPPLYPYSVVPTPPSVPWIIPAAGDATSDAGSSASAPAPTAFVPLPALGDRLCAAKLDHSNFGLFGLRPASAAMDLTTAYRYNQNMMEYYTCKMSFKSSHKNPSRHDSYTCHASRREDVYIVAYQRRRPRLPLARRPHCPGAHNSSDAVIVVGYDVKSEHSPYGRRHCVLVIVVVVVVVMVDGCVECWLASGTLAGDCRPARPACPSIRLPACLPACLPLRPAASRHMFNPQPL